MFDLISKLGLLSKTIFKGRNVFTTLQLQYTHAMFTEIMNILCTIIATIIIVAAWSSLLFTASYCSTFAEKGKRTNKLYHLPFSECYIYQYYPIFPCTNLFEKSIDFLQCIVAVIYLKLNEIGRSMIILPIPSLILIYGKQSYN